MKITKKLSAVLGALIIFVGTFLTVPSAFAEGNIFKLDGVEITDKSAATTAVITGGGEDSFANEVVFGGLDEYVEYTLTLRNTDINARKVVRLTVENPNPYLTYVYNGDIDQTFASGETFDFILIAVYTTEIEGASLADQTFDTLIKITYEDIVTGDEEEEEILAIVVPNTGAGTMQNVGAVAVPAVAILVAAIIVGVRYFKKYKKVAVTTMAVSATAVTVALSFAVNAAATLDDSITIHNDMTFYYRACTGICYYSNGADGGTMADQTAEAGDEVILMASNFSRRGYGFASWNTSPDGTGINYGPNETITMPESGSLKLYANWIESAGEMVGFSCDTLNVGDITALDDTDGQTYAVAKLANGNCWTIENSRKVTNDSANDNTSEDRADNPAPNGDIYAYGHYYSEDEARDELICPTGWRLPSGDDGGDYRALEEALDPDGTQSMDEQIVAWTSYPNNYVFSGLYAPGYGAFFGQTSDALYRGGVGYYLGSDALYDHGNSSYNLYATMFMLPGVEGGTSGSFMAGVQMGGGSGFSLSARCVVGDSYMANITPRDITLTYDANGGVDAPAAETVNTADRTHTFTVTDSVPARNHYHLYAWVEEENKDKVGGVNYIYEEEQFHAGDDYTISADSTLYAIWEENCVNIHYMPNANGVVGEMGVQTICPPKHNATLIAPNYSLAGHSYIGWNTKADGSGTMYGPNEYIDLPAEDDIYLYAQWIEPVGYLTMQEFSGAFDAHAPIGTVIALRDARDDEIYAVAKLADGHWWMIENLRLNLNNPDVYITTSNTNNPTPGFLRELQLRFDNNITSTIAPCATIGAECEDRISFSVAEINRNNPASYNDESNVTSWYAYGGHYNWYTATAGNGTNYLGTERTAGDICPSGWHLPTGRTGAEGSKLDEAMGGNGVRNATYALTNHWLSYPVNFVLAGSYSANETGSARGEQGKLWTSSSSPDGREQGLTIIANMYGYSYFGNNNSTTNKWYALSVRCIANY